MIRDSSEKIRIIKNNVQSWYKWFGPNIYVNLLSRKLYKYSGQMKRGEIRSTQAKAHESQLHDGYQYNVPTMAFESLGVSNGYLQSYPLYGRYAVDLLEHFNIPVYENLVGALHNSVMGGLTKAEINVTASAFSEEYNKQFIESRKKAALKANPIPEINQQIEQIFDQAIQDKDDETFDLNVFSSLIETGLQKFFTQIENKEALMVCLDNLFTMGYSVLKVKIIQDIIKNDEIALDLVEQPEMCFFSPLAQMKDKSDGMFCGMIKIYDLNQIEAMYGDELKKQKVELLELENFVCSNLPFSAEILLIDKHYLKIAQYFEKTKDGKIKMTVCCNNFIFEEIVLDDYLKLPLIFLDYSLSNKWETTSIFNQCFPIQKQYNEGKYKIAKMMLTLSTGKLLLPGNNASREWEELLRGCYSDSTVIAYSPEVGVNASFQPTIMQNIDLPPNALMYIQQLLEEMQYTVNGIMGSELTKGGQSSGAISGISRAIGSLNKNNLFAGRLNIFINGLIKLSNLFSEMFYRVYSRSSNRKYEILKQINEETYLTALEEINLEVFFASDSSFNKEITRQSLIELMKVAQNPILNQVLSTAYCENLESSNQGQLLNAIKIAQEILAKQQQEPQNDPAMTLETEKIKMEAEQKEKERQFKAVESEKDRHHDTWKIITTNEARLLDSQITHNNTITHAQLKAVQDGLLQGIEIADKQEKNEII
jgi:hypothetical protein